MPTLVLLPGLHGTAALFEPLLAEIPLAIARRVIGYPTDRIIAQKDLRPWLEGELEGESDMVLIAESFSGPLALEFAAAHPGRVKAVVLCVSFIAPPVPRILCYLAQPLVFLRMPLTTIGVRAFLAGLRAPRAVVEELKREVRSVKPRVIAHRVRQAAWIDAREALRRCAMPILYLGARRDRLVGRRSLRRIRRIRPDITFKMIDGPHLLLQVRPAEVWKEIRTFLGKSDCVFLNDSTALSESASVC